VTRVCTGAGCGTGAATAAVVAVLAGVGTLEDWGAPLLECSKRSSNREVTASSLHEIGSAIGKACSHVCYRFNTVDIFVIIEF
jgi:hypothetical protein